MKITTIHQVELTSRCNLRCPYCIQSGAMTRPKVDMSGTTWAEVLRWIRYFNNLGTQGELNLAGIGESTLHPRFVDFLLEARDTMGPAGRILFATNGLLMDEALVKAIAPAKPQVYVSLHAPASAAKGIWRLRDAGLLAGVTQDPAINPNDWAGQVKGWSPASYRLPCNWIKQGWGFVSAEGQFLTCCLDATGRSAIGSVYTRPGTPLDEDPTVAEPKKWDLCRTCYQDPD